MILLDSDISISFLKGTAGVISRLRNYGPNTVFLSSISYHELLYGALHSGSVERHLRAVEDFIAPLTVLPFTQFSATYSSKIRQELAAAGQLIGPLDTLIAGHALEHDLTLITGNTREFSRVPSLVLENWL